MPKKTLTSKLPPLPKASDDRNNLRFRSFEKTGSLYKIRRSEKDSNNKRMSSLIVDRYYGLIVDTSQPEWQQIYLHRFKVPGRQGNVFWRPHYSDPSHGNKPRWILSDRSSLEGDDPPVLEWVDTGTAIAFEYLDPKAIMESYRFQFPLQFLG
ncbi:MAG: hypothetical protein F6J98_02380 [Moorea sp. SIO4G2]|nr:hypothetical protein [Moorena sp. SIO4G2]